QSSPDVASDGAGNFVVVWQSDGQDGSSYGIFGQRYAASGVARGPEFPVNTTTTNGQTAPAVSLSGSTGDFVVTWQSLGQDLSAQGIFGRPFSASGDALVAEFQVNVYTTGNQAASAVSVGPLGSFVVAWDSAGQDGSIYGVFARRIAVPTAGPTPT